MRALWDPPKSPKGAAFIKAYKALDAIMRRYGYAPKTGETWGYAPRKITGGTGWSLHAYGPGERFRFWNGVEVTTSVAVDINSRTNPYGRKLVSDMPRAMVEEIEAIRTGGGQRVWRWGGDWNDNNKADDDSHDAMHFELQASPAELATGVYAPIGPAAAPEPAVILEEEEVATAFKYGANQIQTFYVTPAGALTQRWYDPKTGWGHKALAQDADPGGEIAVVKDYLDEKGRLDLFVEGTVNEGLVHAWYSGGAWHKEVLA